MGIGLLMALLFWLSGPAIAAHYGVPVLSPLSGAMALTVLAGAAGAVQRALLTKALDFRPLMLAGAVSVLVSGAVAVWLAWSGYGVWALAAQALASAAATTLVLWLTSRWRPEFAFNLASARRLFGFGGYMLASGLLETTYSRLYTVLIGKLYGVRELGFYVRADTTAQFPSAMLTGIVARVAFPLFSRMADDPVHLGANLRLALQGTMLVNAPAMFGLAAVAEPLVRVLFGEQWRPAVPFLQVLCFSGLMMPFHVLNLQALMGLGRADLFFRLEVVKKAISIAILLAAARFGAVGVAWGMVAAGVLNYFTNAYYSGRLLGYGAASQLRDMAPIWAAAGAMAAGVAWLGEWLGGTLAPAVLLLPLVGAGAVAYSLIVVAFRLAALMSLLRFLRRARSLTPRRA
jgi:O-antigen/teichoic acid export membrane protein